MRLRRWRRRNRGGRRRAPLSCEAPFAAAKGCIGVNKVSAFLGNGRRRQLFAARRGVGVRLQPDQLQPIVTIVEGSFVSTIGGEVGINRRGGGHVGRGGIGGGPLNPFECRPSLRWPILRRRSLAFLRLPDRVTYSLSPLAFFCLRQPWRRQRQRQRRRRRRRPPPRGWPWQWWAS